MVYRNTLYAVITLIVFSSVSHATLLSGPHPRSDQESYKKAYEKAKRDARKQQGLPKKLAKKADNKRKKG